MSNFWIIHGRNLPEPEDSAKGAIFAAINMDGCPPEWQEGANWMAREMQQAFYAAVRGCGGLRQFQCWGVIGPIEETAIEQEVRLAKQKRDKEEQADV